MTNFGSCTHSFISSSLKSNIRNIAKMQLHITNESSLALGWLLAHLFNAVLDYIFKLLHEAFILQKRNKYFSFVF